MRFGRGVPGMTAVALVLAGGLLGAPAASAAEAAPASVVSALGTDVDDFAFTSLDVDYTLTRGDDGRSRLTVVETFVARFPSIDQNHGMRRRIPQWYDSVPLQTTLVSVTDEDGRARSADVESDDGYLVVTSRANGFVHGTQTYVFTYTMENVVRAFQDTQADEFYWDVNGEEWRQPFGRVHATVHLDDALAEATTGSRACYRGFSGETDQCEILADGADGGGATVTASTSSLGPYQVMTIAIGFRPGTFTPFDASYLASPWGWLQGILGVVVLGGVVSAGVVRGRRLRDEPGRPTIIAEYDPPDGVDALEAAVLLGRSTKAIPAEVLEQAVTGSIRIVEGERRLFGRASLHAELLDPSRADADGRMLLDGLFGPSLLPGDVFEFGRSDTRFSTTAQSILRWANAELVRRGLRRRVAGRVRVWPLAVTIVAAALAITFGVVAMSSGVSPLVPVLVLIGSVLAVLLVGGLVARKPLSAAGSEVRDHLLGLKTFIEWAEADRIRMLQSPEGAERRRIDVNDPRQMLLLYERLLPFAVVFGQEREWAQQLAVRYGDGSPYWYSGTHGFSAAAFSAGISHLSSSASSSSSSSSTSGGSSGGGSAGGGGGGGGGGGV